MKILALLTILSSLILAGQGTPYIGLGGSFSNAEDTQVECRMSANALGGIEFTGGVFDIALEGRYATGLSGDYTSMGLYLKPQYEAFYVLIGYGNTDYEFDSFNGLRYGAGIDFGENYANTFIDVVYREAEKDTAVMVGIRYFF